METRSKGGKGVVWGLLVLVLSMPVFATTIDFYTDGIIQDGDVYDSVNVWGIATVDMYGGTIVSSLVLNNNCVVNACGGGVEGGIRIVLYDFATINLKEFHTGQLVTSLRSSETSIINIYGRDFTYANSWLSGYWKNGELFEFYVRDDITFSSISLHEIPEPVTLIFLSMGFCLIKKLRK